MSQRGDYNTTAGSGTEVCLGVMNILAGILPMDQIDKPVLFSNTVPLSVNHLLAVYWFLLHLVFIRDKTNDRDKSYLNVFMYGRDCWYDLDLLWERYQNANFLKYPHKEATLVYRVTIHFNGFNNHFQKQFKYRISPTY